MKAKERENVFRCSKNVILLVYGLYQFTNQPVRYFLIVHSGKCSPGLEINLLLYYYSIVIEFKSTKEKVSVCV